MHNGDQRKYLSQIACPALQGLEQEAVNWAKAQQLRGYLAALKEMLIASVLINCLERLDLSHLALLQTSSESLAGCSERPSSKAAASEEAKRTLRRTLSL